ncbi:MULTISPECIES: hypothetical protein [Anoxybacillus]|nr:MULTISPECIES: hypothetical protein [Anoxybacillus]
MRRESYAIGKACEHYEFEARSGVEYAGVEMFGLFAKFVEK